MQDKVIKIISNITGKTDINNETNFINDLGLNSFDILTLTSAIEDEFNIKIKPRDMWRIRTIGDAKAFLISKGSIID